jgi:glycosyltransferase involved in cell wall biosynthesis
MPPSRDVAVFHPGTQHSWQTAYALQHLDRLAWYATSIYYQPGRFPYTLEHLPGSIGRRLGKQFRRFHHPALDPALVKTMGLSEWLERVAFTAGLPALARRIDFAGNAAFGRGLRGLASDPGVRALWGYNASSETLFAAPEARDKLKILDRTNGDWRAYNAAMDEVSRSFPQWFLPVERRVPDYQIARDQREYELADTILCGSEFAAETVRREGGSAIAGKVRVLGYGYDEALFGNLPAPRPIPPDEPVRFLFLGLAIPRKGIHHALEAIARIPASAASLTIVGHLGVPDDAFAPYADRVTHRPTVARSEVPAIMAAHHVLVFPTYFEGAGIVLYEALAAGCALIQSDRAAPAVTPATGLMLDTVSTDALHRAMLTAIEDRPRLDAWRAAAQTEALGFSFARYRDGIAALLDELLD